MVSAIARTCSKIRTKWLPSKRNTAMPLDVPQTYDQFMDIAKFFTRPDEGLYGVAIYTQKDYDAMTMGIENTLFPFGADWKDADNNVQGVINSPEAVAAVEYYKELYDCCQAPGLSNAFFVEVNDAMIGGQAAMGMNYFAFLPALVNPGTNPDYWDKMGFFQNPAGPSGERGAALGGQGTSIVSYISPERQQASMDFLEWFGSDEVQAKWAEVRRLHHQPGRVRVRRIPECHAVQPGVC